MQGQQNIKNIKINKKVSKEEGILPFKASIFSKLNFPMLRSHINPYSYKDRN